MLIYDTQPTLIEINGEIIEVLFPHQSEIEKAAQALKEKEEGSIIEDLYDRAKEQRADRIENDYFTQRG